MNAEQTRGEAVLNVAVTSVISIPQVTLEKLVGRPCDGSEAWETEAQEKGFEYAFTCVGGYTTGDLVWEAGDAIVEGELDYKPVCVCSPEQLARGGFNGRCPIHA